MTQRSGNFKKDKKNFDQEVCELNINLNIPGMNSMGGPGGINSGMGPSSNQMMMMLMMMMQVIMQLISGQMGGGYPMSQSGSDFGGGGGGIPQGLAPSGSPLNNFLGGSASPSSGGSSSAAPTLSGPMAASDPVNVNNGNYAFPIQGYDKSQGVNLHHGSHHGAADFFAPRGTPVVAMRAGTVVKTGSGGAGGNTVTVKGDDGNMYYYAHLNEAASVQNGQRVEAGMPIGKVGDSGNARGTGTHLHLGVGPEILNGTGPAGGAGSGGFDLTGLLRQVLAAS